MRYQVSFFCVHKYQSFLRTKAPKIASLQYLRNTSKLFIARYAQSNQNSKFVISLQYLKKEGRNKVDFLHADKHQTFLQVDPINLGGNGQACPNYPK